MPPGQGRGARPSLTATAASVAVRAPDRQGMRPPGHGSWWCRAPPADSVRPARAARGEIVYGDRAHHRLSPSRGVPELPTGRASPNTAPVGFDTVLLVARGMLGVVARPGPTPEGGPSGSQARHGHGEKHTP